jgi:hypothetical protein
MTLSYSYVPHVVRSMTCIFPPYLPCPFLSVVLSSLHISQRVCPPISVYKSVRQPVLSPPPPQPSLSRLSHTHIHVYIPFQAASIHVCRESPSNVGARRTVDPANSHLLISIASHLPSPTVLLPNPTTSTPPCCQNDWNITLSIDSDAVFLTSPSPCAYTLVLPYVRLLHGRLCSRHFQFHSGRFP